MIEVLKQSAEDVSKAYDVLAFAHTERALEILAKTRTSLRQAIAELESQEPVAWIDPTTLHHLKIGLEGVHLVYETEMVNSLPLYEKPQGWRDNVAQAYLKGFDEGCKSMSARNGDTTGRWSGKTENIGSLGMPVNVPVTPPQRTWVGLTDEDRYEFAAAQYSWEELLIAAEAKLKEKNSA
jgi:hypothetical protein